MPENDLQNANSPEISLVIPVFDEKGSLPELKNKVTGVLENLGKSFEIIFIDDGSRDGSAELLAGMQEKDSRVTVIRFRRNFGKSAALNAGFRLAAGKYIFTMDGDLQDDPEEIPHFIAKLEEGYDLVSGWKHHRNDPLDKTLPSKLFNKVTSAVSGLKLHDFNCGFKLYRSEVVKTLRIYGELHRYVPALAHWRGFRVAEVKVTHHPRIHGKSKFGSERFLKGLLDLLTVLFLNRYNRRPLHFFGRYGLLLCSIGFLIGLYFVGYWLIHQNIGGRVPLLLFAVFLMLGGIQLISTGLIAEMIANTQEELHPAYHQIAEIRSSKKEK